MPFVPLYAVSLLLHGLLAWRLLPALAAYAWPWASVTALGLALSALLLPMGLLGTRSARGSLGQWLSWAGLLCMGLFSSLLVLTLLRDALLLLLDALQALGLAGTDSAGLRQWSALALVPAAALLTAWGFVNARRTAGVVTVDLPIAGLPPALQGFRIVQISDIHVGPTIGQAYLERIVARVNALDADVVAITGDLVDGPVSRLGPLLAPLQGLRARHGSFFVTGNHEYYSGAEAWVVQLRQLGLVVLMNEHRVIQHQAPSGESAALLLAGVTDYSAGQFIASHRSDPQQAIAGAPAAAVRILLAHQPRSAAAAAQAGFDVQLSGHTHGGQFWPWGYFVRLQQPFTAGLHRFQSLWVYTSRGTGYWGPPKRLGAASEIGVLRLVAAPH